MLHINVKHVRERISTGWLQPADTIHANIHYACIMNHTPLVFV